MIGLITLGMKPAGERRTGNPCAPFDRAGAGDGCIAYRASSRPYSLDSFCRETGFLLPKGMVARWSHARFRLTVPLRGRVKAA
jgi:hypothetical protein